MDDKQQELIRDNLELKELCLYLDEERANASQNCRNCGAANANNSVLRDDGDGSSSSTNADEPIPNNMHSYEQNLSVRVLLRWSILIVNLCKFNFQDLNMRNPNPITDQTIQYVRSLERRIQQLEEEQSPPMTAKSMAKLESNGTSTNGQKAPPKPMTPTKRIKVPQSITSQLSNSSLSSDPIINGRPEAVVRALQVLEVREQLERDRAGASSNQMDDGEKALIREMCNVVWRKLEETNSDGGLDI